MSDRYTLEFPGLVLVLDAESYPGSGDADILGDSRWTFQREDLERAGLLADPDDGSPFLYVESSAYRTEEVPLLHALHADALENAEDEEERAEVLALEGVESSRIDACIVTLRALLERAEARHTDADASPDGGESSPEPWRVRVGWYGECSAFWAFHDITHALEDVDWSGGSAGVYLAGGWAEDRANLEGARRAVRAGVPVAEVLAELAGLRGAFRERFKGEESSALADFLAGESGCTDEGRAAHAERVADLAADILDGSDEGEDLDAVRERAWEYVEGVSLSTEEAGSVLLYTDNADRAEEWADGDSVDLASRAFGALLGDVEDALADAFAARACADCAERLPAKGRRVCGDCAHAYTDEEREEREREVQDEEREEREEEARAAELERLAQEEADKLRAEREERERRERDALHRAGQRSQRLQLLASPDTSPEGRATLARLLERDAAQADTPEEDRARILATVREHAPRPPGSAPFPYPRTYAELPPWARSTVGADGFGLDPSRGMAGEECAACGASVEGVDVDAHACEPVLHLAVFARLGLARAACGAKLGGSVQGTEDAARVTCADCAGRVVREEPAP